jgi:hypothetical protein
MKDKDDVRSSGMANLERVWALKPGMAMDVGIDFFTSLAWLDEPSLLFGNVGDAQRIAAAKKLSHNQGVRVTDHMTGRFTIYRPETTGQGNSNGST